MKGLEFAPPACRELAEVSTAIRAIVAPAVVPIGAAHALRPLVERRAELREHIRKGRNNEPGGTGGTPAAMAA